MFPYLCFHIYINIRYPGSNFENETKLNDMAHIIEDVSQHVPVHDSTVSADIQGNTFNIDDSRCSSLVTNLQLHKQEVLHYYKMMTR